MLIIIFLGFALLQLPDLMNSLHSKILKWVKDKLGPATQNKDILRINVP